MSICAIIPIANLDAANNALDDAGFGPDNFSVAAYTGLVVSHAGLHAWNDSAFESALVAISGTVVETSGGDPATRFQTLAEAQGARWRGRLPTGGAVPTESLFTSNGAGGVTFMFAGAAPNPQFTDNQDGTTRMVAI